MRGRVGSELIVSRYALPSLQRDLYLLTRLHPLASSRSSKRLRQCRSRSSPSRFVIVSPFAVWDRPGDSLHSTDPLCSTNWRRWSRCPSPNAPCSTLAASTDIVQAIVSVSVSPQRHVPPGACVFGFSPTRAPLAVHAFPA